MKKRITNENVGELIGKIATQIREELDRELSVATSHLIWAEHQLTETFDENQKELFKEYLENQERVNKIKKEFEKLTK